MVTFYVRETRNGKLFLEADGLETVDDPLIASLKKWETLDRYVQEGLLIRDGGSATCALCQRYRGCVGCPVLIYTGAGGCGNTSYNDYVSAVGQRDRDAALIAAQDMILLLRRLLHESNQ